MPPASSPARARARACLNSAGAEKKVARPVVQSPSFAGGCEEATAKMSASAAAATQARSARDAMLLVAHGVWSASACGRRRQQRVVAFVLVSERQAGTRPLAA